MGIEGVKGGVISGRDVAGRYSNEKLGLGIWVG